MTAWMMTWLWQGLALAAVVALVLRCAPRLNGATRHMIWSGALLALPVLGWSAWPTEKVTRLAVATAIYVPSVPDFVISLLLGIWAALALANLIRVLPALHAVYVLRDRCRPFPPNVESRLRLWRGIKRRGRHADLMVCDAVAGATVLGLQRPYIAIPSPLIQALTVDELDQVILHEHAHIQRGDDWARLVEALLLPVLCVHPAATFIARAMNRERETACDEWVVAHTGERKAYARCLARAAEIRRRTGSDSALVPALLGHRHELARRVERVLAMQGSPRRNASFGGAAIAACVIALMSIQLHGLRFAEIANILFPIEQVRRVQIQVQPVQGVQEVQGVQGVQGVRRVRRVQQVQQVQQVQGVRSVQDPAPSAENAAMAPNALVADEAVTLVALNTPVAPNAPVDAPSAPLAPVAPIAPIAPIAPLASGPWTTFASTGIEVASIAKKTSTGVASVFSRAGVSLARSF